MGFIEGRHTYSRYYILGVKTTRLNTIAHTGNYPLAQLCKSLTGTLHSSFLQVPPNAGCKVGTHAHTTKLGCVHA